MATVGLFAGIGGLERGLAQAGHETLLFCELDSSASAVLEHRFPGVPIHSDINTLRRLPRQTELLVGGFPCQDLSQAGRTRGIQGGNSGLVSHVFRLLEQQRVPWVLLENVPFMLQLSRGRAMNVLVSEFERLGYKWAYRVVDTRAFGLPQRRQRVLFVASLEEEPHGILLAEDAEEPEQPAWTRDLACGFYWTEGIRGLGWAVDAIPTLKGGSTVGVPSPPAIVLPNGNVVTPDIRDAERLQGFPKNWTRAAGSVGRESYRWKLVGNAVSVPVARWAGAQLARPAIEFALRDVRPLRSGTPWPSAAWNVGNGRFTGAVSAWPKRYKRKHLAEFLIEEPKPLSLRATSGFLERTQRAKLRFPDGFIDALRRHLERMIDEEAA